MSAVVNFIANLMLNMNIVEFYLDIFTVSMIHRFMNDSCLMPDCVTFVQCNVITMILTCAEELTSSQLSTAHNKTKIKE